MDAKYLAHAFRDAKTVEFRLFRGDWITSYQYSSLEPSLILGQMADGNSYTTLNRPKHTAHTVLNYALRDHHIAQIVRLPFDFDPVRPAGVPSTDAEMNLAIKRRDRFVTFMSGLGWPMPALGLSGNGAHALYRCSLPNDDVTKQILKTLYIGLRDAFSDESVIFDATVRNPSRIWRLYGTMNRKGESTPERPHRMAEVWIPPRWEGVSPAQIRSLSDTYASTRQVLERKQRENAPITGKGDYRTLDVAGWFRANGLYRFDMGSGKHSVVCPWDHEHSTKDGPESTATVVWEADGGWPNFCCRHAHCEDRGMRDVISALGNADQFCSKEWARC